MASENGPIGGQRSGVSDEGSFLFDDKRRVAQIRDRVAADRRVIPDSVMVSPLWSRGGSARYRVNLVETSHAGPVVVRRYLSSAFLIVPDPTNGRRLKIEQLAAALQLPVSYLEVIDRSSKVVSV